MSKGINKVALLGHVGSSIEVQTTRSGVLVANVSLATSERFKKNDEWTDRTEWHALVFFGRLAELVRDYVNKGSRIHVEGKLSTRSWDDAKLGVKRYKTEIIVNDLTLLGDSSVTRAAHDDYSQGEPGEQYAGAY
jgi:single-strand DNA-binding protein